jgi:hypothetical protein
MFKLFRKHLEIETVATDIVQDFLDTEVRLIFEFLKKQDYQHDSIVCAGETFAFVFIIAILGINMSQLN